MRSLILIKPDGVEKNVVGNVLSMYEENNLKIVELKMVTITKEFAGEHYKEHKGKVFYDDLISFITRGPLVCAVLEDGEDIIEKVRAINGSTDPKEAAPGTVRALYGKDKTQNCVHASDSLESARREIDLWFK